MNQNTTPEKKCCERCNRRRGRYENPGIEKTAFSDYCGNRSCFCHRQPTVITSFPGEAVDRHLKKFGHLPTTDLCDENGTCSTTQQEADWEKEFDEEFNLKYQERVNHGYFAGNEKIADVKAFIRRTRQQAVAEDRKALREKIEGMKPTGHAPSCRTFNEAIAFGERWCDCGYVAVSHVLERVKWLLTSQDDEN